MSKLLHMSVSPHVHCGRSTSDIMRDVFVALVPAAGAGIMIFGLRALLVIAICVGACVGLEALFNYIVKKEQTIGDYSAAVTGLLLALNLPANIPLWQCVVGSAFAIIVVKCLFGGLGYNVVNPAITARVFMLVSFASVGTAASSILPDAVAGATPLVQIAEGSELSLKALFLGNHGGAIGETCALALLFGFLYLLISGVITWQIPVTYIGSVFVLSLLMEGNATTALALTLSGGLLIGAIFMATDYVTSPVTPFGKVVFGLGCGLLTFLIRYFGSYPEGVSFAILIMNILTPYIDKFTAHKVFGGKKA
jgi:electron transport complex protein RnfD